MPEEKRPEDVTLREMVGKPEAEVVAWWTTRFQQLAAIPVATARAGAFIPIMRELATLPRDQRIALTRARVLAFQPLSSDVTQAVFEARSLAANLAPEVEELDRRFVGDAVLPTLPPDVAERLKAQMEQISAGRR